MDNGFVLVANKYSKYFNQRIYFVLILAEITKHVDNEVFLESYKDMAAAVKKKKEN